MKTVIAIVASILMMGCSGTSNIKPMNTLPDTLQVGQNLLSRDSIEQPVYPVITQHQRSGLTRFTRLDVPDSTVFIGARPAGDGMTLEAYQAPTGEGPNHFKVYLVTRDSKDVIVDHLDLGEFHTSEHQGPMRLGGNRFYTTDAELRFDGPNSIVLHRVMTLTSIYLKDHRLTELWRVEWDNRYEITGDGRFNFKGQQETNRTEGVDDPVIDDYQSRDRAVKD